MMPRNVLEKVQSQRFGIDAVYRAFEFGMPISIVPPNIETDLQQRLQLFFAVSDLRGRKHVFGAFDRFGVIVKHDLYAVTVRELHEPRHVGKEIQIDVVTDPAVGSGAPVGIDHHIVERKTMCFVI